MAEGGAGTCPQVFVVDSQANYICEPSGRNSRWMNVGQKTLLSLTGLTMFGLVVQGCLIYNLYKKTEVRLIGCGVSVLGGSGCVGVGEVSM